jgi:hypothetical protein
MTPPDDGSMHQQIGNLSGKLDMLIEAVRRSEEKSDLSRASVHRRMDELVERVTKVETGMKDVQGDVTKMQPVVDKITAWDRWLVHRRHRGIGTDISADDVFRFLDVLADKSWTMIRSLGPPRSGRRKRRARASLLGSATPSGNPLPPFSNQRG